MTKEKPEAPAGPIGSLRAENGRGVVRMEDVYATDIDDLWSAITDPERLSRWLAVVSGDLRLGGEFFARFTSGWEGTSRIDACEAPHRLIVTSDEHGTTLMATLTAEGSKRRLVIEDHGLPLEEYANHGSGWQAHLEDLATYLAGRPANDWKTRWEELTPAYLELVKSVPRA